MLPPVDFIGRDVSEWYLDIVSFLGKVTRCNPRPNHLQRLRGMAHRRLLPVNREQRRQCLMLKGVKRGAIAEVEDVFLEATHPLGAIHPRADTVRLEGATV
jgi:hypothetical protein